MRFNEFDLQFHATPVQPTAGTFGVSGTANTIHYTDADRDNEVRFGKLLEPGLRKIFFESYDEIPEQYPMIYNMNTSSKAKETDWGMGAFGDWVQRADQFSEVDYKTLSPGLERTYTHSAFTQGFMITKEMMDDEQYNQMNKMAKAMGRSGRAKVEKDAITILTKGFATLVDGTTANTGGEIYDTSFLFADDHPLLDSAEVGSNLVEGPLSDAKLKEIVTKMRATVDEAGNLIQARVDKLIIPPALEDTAKRILHSTQISGGQLNDTNEYLSQYGIKIVVMDYLGAAAGGSDTAWFVQDSSLHELNFFWRVKPEFKWTEDFDTFVAKYRGYMRYSFGVSDWRGIAGSLGL